MVLHRDGGLSRIRHRLVPARPFLRWRTWRKPSLTLKPEAGSAIEKIQVQGPDAVQRASGPAFHELRDSSDQFCTDEKAHLGD